MESSASCPAAAAPLERPFRVLVGVTGSVAALKLPLLVSRLLDIPGLEVAVVTTERAKHFYSPQDIPVTLYSDADEWEMWKCRSDPVLHIDLRRWADLMLVAPLDANTLGKVASGICDNLLVSDSACLPPSLGLHSQFSELQDCLYMGFFPWNSFMMGWFAPWAPCPLLGPTAVPASGQMDGLTLCVLRVCTSHLPLDTLSFVHRLPSTWSPCPAPLPAPLSSAFSPGSGNPHVQSDKSVYFLVDLLLALISPVALATRQKCGFPVCSGKLRGQERSKAKWCQPMDGGGEQQESSAQNGDCLMPKGPPGTCCPKRPCLCDHPGRS
uniref:Flavoprotein domain-containing protein n=1 Tax=Suricata suricatta TaxID=37032 RepID=A0A673V5B3_SURSU